MSEKRVRFQNLERLHRSIRAELQTAFDQILNTSAFIQGTPVSEFERQFAAFSGAPYCLGVANGTDALEIALEAMGVGAGDTVAIPSMTFVATAEAVVRRGAQPLIVDVDAETLCLSPDILEEAITHFGRPVKAIIPVHLYGRACDLDSLRRIADSHHSLLLEDCAQAHGARSQGKPVGTVGSAGTFSFYPGKNLGALGDAGAITTTSEELYSKMRRIRDHGRSQKYVHDEVGRNSRMDGLQAAFLSVKLKHLPEWTSSRKRLAQAYARELEGIPAIRMFPTPSDAQSHVFHLLVVRVRRGESGRDELAAWLSERGIETGIHYPLGVHMQPAYLKYPRTRSLENTEVASDEILSLPFDPLMTEDEVRLVCTEIRKFYG